MVDWLVCWLRGETSIHTSCFIRAQSALQFFLLCLIPHHLSCRVIICFSSCSFWVQPTPPRPARPASAFLGDADQDLDERVEFMKELAKVRVWRVFCVVVSIIARRKAQRLGWCWPTNLHIFCCLVFFRAVHVRHPSSSACQCHRRRAISTPRGCSWTASGKVRRALCTWLQPSIHRPPPRLCLRCCRGRLRHSVTQSALLLAYARVLLS